MPVFSGGNVAERHLTRPKCGVLGPFGRCLFNEGKLSAIFRLSSFASGYVGFRDGREVDVTLGWAEAER